MRETPTYDELVDSVIAIEIEQRELADCTGDILDHLHDGISMLMDKNRKLEARIEYLEDQCAEQIEINAVQKEQREAL